MCSLLKPLASGEPLPIELITKHRDWVLHRHAAVQSLVRQLSSCKTVDLNRLCAARVEMAQLFRQITKLRNVLTVQTFVEYYDYLNNYQKVSDFNLR